MSRLAFFDGRCQGRQTPSVLISVALLLMLSGCKDNYREQSEPMYQALVQLNNDAKAGAQIQTFAIHLTAADNTREEWARHVCHFRCRRKSARTMDDILQTYGKIGTLRMMEGAKRVGDRPADRAAFHEAELALSFTRYDLDSGR